jgi:hypothetical protein
MSSIWDERGHSSKKGCLCSVIKETKPSNLSKIRDVNREAPESLQHSAYLLQLLVCLSVSPTRERNP